MKRNRFAVAGMVILSAGLLLLAGCATASKMLEKAETAWAGGQYVSAIEYALQSYEKAVDKNKEPSEIAAAKSFLEDKFPLANEYTLERAEQQLDGSEADQANAWKTFETLVNMNRRVRDSIASHFLSVQDFSEELQKAKETAAHIKYNKAIELMGQDKRNAYIEAYTLFNEIDAFVADYRDIRELADMCREAGTYTVAVSDRALPFTVKEGEAVSYPELASDAYDDIKAVISSNDYPEFLEFVTAGSVKGAEDLGAGLFIEIQGEVWVSSEEDNDYQRNGTVTWERTMGGNPTIVVTRISDTRNEIATANLYLDQEISVEFYVQKYSTEFLNDDMFNRFGNMVWMNSQLSNAKIDLKDDEGEAFLEVFAEMQYGGGVDFKDKAEMTDHENGGTKWVPIDSSVYSSTESFINNTIPAFMAFEDVNFQNDIVGDMTSTFLASSGVKELLTDLGD